MPCRIAIAFLLPFVVLNPSAQGEAPGLAEDIVVKSWDFSTGTQGWHSQNLLTPAEVSDGVLRVRQEGFDAFMGVVQVGVDTAEVSHVRIRMRAENPGPCQIYFTTDANPNPVINGCVDFFCPDSEDFHTFEFQLSPLTGWAGTLDLFRLDPVNSGHAGTLIEIDEVTLLRKGPRVVVTGFHADKAWAAPGNLVTFRVEATNLGGPFQGTLNAVLSSPDGKELGLGGDAAIGLLYDPTRKTYRGAWRVTVPEGPVARFDASITMDGAPMATARTTMLAVARGTMPDPNGEPTEYGPVLEGEHLALQFIGDDAGLAGAVVRYRYPGHKAWRFLGVCHPLAGLMVADESGQHWTTTALQLSETHGAGMTLHAALPQGRIVLNLRLRDADGIVEMRSGFSASRETGLLRFSGPAYRVGEGGFRNRKEMALFPGVEYLGENEPSSDAKYAGEKLGYRPVPPPNHITVPLMAVTRDEVTTGLLWEALQTWAPNRSMPMAEFASPNFLDGQDNHLMALFVPNAPLYVTPNTRAAVQPYELASGDNVALEQRLFVECTSDVHEAVAVWYREFGVCAPITLVKPREAFFDDCMMGWADTCYDRAADGFVSHWRFGLQPTPMPLVKARLVQYGREAGSAKWAEMVKADPAAKLVDVMGSQFDAFYPARPETQLAAQRADGTWLYDDTADDRVLRMTRELSNGTRRMLGDYGYTNAGICAFQAQHVLIHAMHTGDPVTVEAGLRALEAMKRYRIPAGPSAFELHAETPDLWAGALIAKCFLMGYELTLDEAYLKQAHYWLRTGLPFFFAYELPNTGGGGMWVNVPDDPLTKEVDEHVGTHAAEWAFEYSDRKVTPYANIPVFGTTFYVIPWFGNVVQWEGLVWANTVHELLGHTEDPLLASVAEGAIRSACHQTFGKAPIRGLLPDVFAIQDNTLTGAFIGPSLLEQALRNELDRPDYATGKATVLHLDGKRIHLTNRGVILDATWDEHNLQWEERYPVGESCETTIVGLGAAPDSVTADVELPQVPQASAVVEGWQYDASRDLLHVRVRHGMETLRVAVR